MKKSYYYLARVHHPDRVCDDDKSIANEKFHVIHQACLVLSDPEQRKRYDDGFNVLFPRPTIVGEWERCLRPVNNADVHTARTLYQNSYKEKCDIEREYLSGKGSMTHMLNNIPFMRVEDEPRVIEIIKRSVIKGKVPKLKIKKIPNKRIQCHCSVFSECIQKF